jgi:hypothetical protein
MQAAGVTRPRVGLLGAISLLAVVFTVALTFATLQLPRIVGSWLSSYFPDIHPIVEPERIAQFMAVACPVGYACLGMIALLIVAGLVRGKRKLSILGSVAFLLPTFAVYASILIVLSPPFVLLDFPQGIGWSGWPGHISGAF